jgi:hypothetical protein
MENPLFEFPSEIKGDVLDQLRSEVTSQPEVGTRGASSGVASPAGQRPRQGIAVEKSRAAAALFRRSLVRARVDFCRHLASLLTIPTWFRIRGPMRSMTVFVFGVTVGVIVSYASTIVGIAIPASATGDDHFAGMSLGRRQTAFQDVELPAPPMPPMSLSQVATPVPPIARRTISPVFRGTLHVTSTPSGADVFLNGQPFGTTPLVLNRLPVGSTALRLTLEGYELWSRGIQVVSDRRTVVTAHLVPAGSLLVNAAVLAK